MPIFDSTGKKIADVPPKPLSATFCKQAHLPFMVEDLIGGYKEEMMRIQVPHVVTLLVYESKFQLQATQREYFVYAPPDMKSAVALALKLWKRWEKPHSNWFVDKSEDYPKVDDAVVAEKIDDNCFAEMWQSACKRKFKAAGHPHDPFAFTCLDPDVMLYKSADFQSGLIVTV